MIYEQAKKELEQIVFTLESGGGTLDDTLALWDRGVELGRICQQQLQAADRRIEAALTGGAK